jgi:outer membrane receptor for ferrienterochelin and colicin
LSKQRTFVAVSAAILAVSTVTAAAQNAAKPELEEVVIVGTQIRGAKLNDVLPVTVVEKEDIVATAAVSGDELFRSIPQAGDVQFQEARTTGNLNDARGDTSSINLRNLGTGNTLVLLNRPTRRACAPARKPKISFPCKRRTPTRSRSPV